MATYLSPEGLKKIADFLRNGRKFPVRHGVQHDKRVEYFKGSKLVDFLVNNTEKKKKGRPNITNEADAIRVCRAMLAEGYFHRSERIEKGVLKLVPPSRQEWAPKEFYTWIYDGDQTTSYFMTALLIIGFLLLTCFPIWPTFLKIWLWYISVTLLIFMLGFITIRAVIFLIFWIMGFEFWILPRLFDDNLGFTESFTPGYTFEKVAGGQLIYRLGAFGAIGGLFYWAYTQPTDFDTFLSVQRDFLDDLYSGNLLSDMSQQSKEDIDKVKIPTLEDLMAETDNIFETEDNSEDIVSQFMDDMLKEDAKAEAAMDDEDEE
ncbi:unnamed protein product [Heterosigma akashiwo]